MVKCFSFPAFLLLKVWARATNGRIFLERFLKITLEELLTDHLWRYVPVEAIGDPHDKGKLAPLGAARDYESDATWQQTAIALMRQATIIAAVVGETSGFLWEIDTIVKLGFMSELILVLPPSGHNKSHGAVEQSGEHSNWFETTAECQPQAHMRGGFPSRSGRIDNSERAEGLGV